MFNAVPYSKGAVYNVAGASAWKCISFVNSLIIAALFSVQYSTDVYFYLIMLAGLAGNLFLNVNISAVIPEAMHKEGREQHAFINCVLLFYLLLGAACVAGALSWPGMLGKISRFDISSGATFMWAAVYFASLLITQFLINILEMKGMFKVAWLYPLNALIPFLFLVFLGRTLGVKVMLMGFSAAQVLQALFCVYALAYAGWTADFKSSVFSKEFKKNLSSVLVLEGMSMVVGIVPMFIMSGLGAGFVSALNYAKALFETPGEIITNKVLSAHRIEFNALSAKQNYEGLNTAFQKTFLILILFMTPICVFTTVFSHDLVSAFFMRGHFGAAAAAKTAMFLMLFMPSVFILLPSYVHRALLASAKKMKDFLPFQALGCVISIIFIYVAMQLCGPYGYPAGFMATNILWLAIAYFMLKKLMPYIKYLQSLGIMFSALAFNILAVLPSVFLAQYIGGLWTRCIVCGSLFVIITALISQKFYRMKI